MERGFGHHRRRRTTRRWAAGLCRLPTNTVHCRLSAAVSPVTPAVHSGSSTVVGAVPSRVGRSVPAGFGGAAAGVGVTVAARFPPTRSLAAEATAFIGGRRAAIATGFVTGWCAAVTTGVAAGRCAAVTIGFTATGLGVAGRLTATTGVTVAERALGAATEFPPTPTRVVIPPRSLCSATQIRAAPRRLSPTRVTPTPRCLSVPTRITPATHGLSASCRASPAMRRLVPTGVIHAARRFTAPCRFAAVPTGVGGAVAAAGRRVRWRRCRTVVLPRSTAPPAARRRIVTRCLGCRADVRPLLAGAAQVGEPAQLLLAHVLLPADRKSVV